MVDIFVNYRMKYSYSKNIHLSFDDPFINANKHWTLLPMLTFESFKI